MLSSFALLRHPIDKLWVHNLFLFLLIDGVVMIDQLILILDYDGTVHDYSTVSLISVKKSKMRDLN